MAGMLMGLQPSGGSGGGAAFDPTQQPGLFAWLNIPESGIYQDAARTTLASANNDPVGGWPDFSGNGNHFSQSTAGARPLLKTSLGGKQFVLADGVDDWLQLLTAIGSGYEIFATAYTPRTSFPGPSPQVDYLICSGVSGITCYEFSMYNSFGTTANNAFYMVHLTNQWLDGASVSSGAAISGATIHTMSALTDGAATSNLGYYLFKSSDNVYHSNIALRELVVYSSARTAGQRSQLHTYLAGH